jgi:hypothetical protein
VRRGCDPRAPPGFVLIEKARIKIHKADKPDLVSDLPDAGISMVGKKILQASVDNGSQDKVEPQRKGDQFIGQGTPLRHASVLYSNESPESGNSG